MSDEAPNLAAVVQALSRALGDRPWLLMVSDKGGNTSVMHNAPSLQAAVEGTYRYLSGLRIRMKKNRKGQPKEAT